MPRDRPGAAAARRLAEQLGRREEAEANRQLFAHLRMLERQDAVAARRPVNEDARLADQSADDDRDQRADRRTNGQE